MVSQPAKTASRKLTTAIRSHHVPQNKKTGDRWFDDLLSYSYENLIMSVLPTLNGGFEPRCPEHQEETRRNLDQGARSNAESRANHTRGNRKHRTPTRGNPAQ